MKRATSDSGERRVELADDSRRARAGQCRHERDGAGSQPQAQRAPTRRASTRSPRRSASERGEHQHRHDEAREVAQRQRSAQGHAQVVASAPSLGAEQRAQCRRVAVMDAAQPLVGDDAKAGGSKAPAKIHVLAGFERDVEATDALKRSFRTTMLPEPSHSVSCRPVVRPRSAPYISWTHVPPGGFDVQRPGGGNRRLAHAVGRRGHPPGGQLMVGVDKREDVARGRACGAVSQRGHPSGPAATARARRRQRPLAENRRAIRCPPR